LYNSEVTRREENFTTLPVKAQDWVEGGGGLCVCLLLGTARRDREKKKDMRKAFFGCMGRAETREGAFRRNCRE